MKLNIAQVEKWREEAGAAHLVVLAIDFDGGHKVAMQGCTNKHEEAAIAAARNLKTSSSEGKVPKLQVEVKHSLSKAAWNVINNSLGRKYKIARVPYVIVDGNDIITTINKNEALEHAFFICKCFNNTNDDFSLL